MNDFKDSINIPSTKELIQIYNLKTNKKLGQNFLVDNSITDRILNYLPNLNDKVILEVGAGPGGLTRSILFKKPKKLIAIEFDPNCIPILKVIQTTAENVLEVIEGDAIKFDENIIEGKLSIIANLPYNIGSTLILKWLDKIDKFEFIVVMLQSEVAMRLSAEPGHKNYGRLSIIAQCLADVEVLFELEPYNFFPPPKVKSAVVRLIPKQNRKKIDLKILSKITQAAFGLRRKKIKTSLVPLLTQDMLESLSINCNKRAENLTVEEYISITQFLMSSK